MPKYEYLHHRIRNDIRTGILAGNTKLPSKRALSQHLDISVSTVEQAYDLLISESYIYSKPGSGYYVCPNRNEGTYQNVKEEIEKSGEGDITVFDMKANHSPQELFPAETWARLMRKTLSDHHPELYDTIPFNGLFALRQAIASYLYEFKGIRATPDQIVIGAGTEYLYGRLLQLFGSRCTIGIGDYGSKNLFNVSQGTGTRWEYFHVDSDGLNLDTLDESPVDAVHVSPANHFPTGVAMSQRRRKQLLDWAHREPQHYIIEDDYDSELRYSGRPAASLFAQDNGEKVIYLNTFSKTLVPSIRISYMVLPFPLMELYTKQLSFYSCTVSSFEQYTLAQFISGGYFERHIMRLRRFYDKRMSIVIEAFEKSPLMKIATLKEVEVGTHLLLHVNTRYSDSQIREAAARENIHLAMLSDYCARDSVYNNGYLVINVASIVSGQVEDVVHALQKVFEEDINRNAN